MNKYSYVLELSGRQKNEWTDGQETDGQNEDGKMGVIFLCHQHSSLTLRLKRGSRCRVHKMVNILESKISAAGGKHSCGEICPKETFFLLYYEDKCR